MAGIDEKTVTAWVGAADAATPSLRSYAYCIGAYSDFLEGRGVALGESSALDVREFALEVASEHRPSTANGIVSAVRRFYAWAAEQGICRDVARGVEPVGEWNPYSRVPLSADEAVRIVGAAAPGRDRAMLSLAARCDLKPRDIVAASADGLLFEGDSGEIRLADGSWAPLTRACAADLWEHVGRSGAAPGPRGCLFASESNRSAGERLSARSVREVFAAAFRDAGMPLPAGEYATGSAALKLAVIEDEPLEVVISLCDRSHCYRKRTGNRPR